VIVVSPLTHNILHSYSSASYLHSFIFTALDRTPPVKGFSSIHRSKAHKTMFHSSTTISPTFLGLLAASVDIPFVTAEITTDQLYGKLTSTAAPAPGFNVEGGSVFENYLNALKNKQLFIHRPGTLLYERPETEPARISTFNWCSDLTFSDLNNSSLIGYAGRCLGMYWDGYADIMESGDQNAYYYSKGE
jgi:hypothetical protein